MTSLTIQGTAAPAGIGCVSAANRFGTQVLTTVALSQLNPQIQTNINNGTTNVLMEMLGLDDPTGLADPNGLSIGVISGALDPSKGAWPGTNPIDWWFLTDYTMVNPSGVPTKILPSGTLAARSLKAGPGSITLPLILGGATALLQMSNAKIAATLSSTPPPNAPSPPPSQVAAGLTVFQTMTASGAGQGLCGNITVESLANIPAPQALSVGGASPCGACSGSHTYTYCGNGNPVGPSCNSFLDVMVGGCKILTCLATATNAGQPDVAGTDGDVDVLTVGANNKVDASLTTGNDDAYSSYFTFDANRAHITGSTCTITGDCQAGLTCVGGICK